MAPPSTPNKYPPSSAFDEMVKIKVGTGTTARSFQMCKGVLCFYSGYFTGAFKGKFVEASKGEVELKTVEAPVFEKFKDWVYTRRFCNEHEVDTDSVDWETLIKLWVFGDAHEIPLLQNESIDLLKRKIFALWVVPNHQIIYTYESTTTSSKLRKFLIEIIAKIGGKHLLHGQDEIGKWTREALLDLLDIVWEREPEFWTSTDVDKLNMCTYHVHEEGVTCKDGKREQ